jgi:hypothetical protein
MQAARALARVSVAARVAAPVLRIPLQARAAAPARAYSGRAPDGALEQLYHVLLKKNINFIMFILGGAIIMETVYGGIGNTVWNTVNNNVSMPSLRHTTHADRFNVHALPRAAVGQDRGWPASSCCFDCHVVP